VCDVIAVLINISVGLC